MDTEDLSSCLFVAGGGAVGGGDGDFDDSRGVAAEQERTWHYLHQSYAAFLR